MLLPFFTLLPLILCSRYLIVLAHFSPHNHATFTFGTKLQQVKNAFEEANVSQDLSITFDPQYLLEIDWPLTAAFGEESFTPSLGEHLYDSQTTLPFTNIRLTIPKSHQNQNDDTLNGPYIITLLDPDAPANENPYWRSFRHFFASDFYATTKGPGSSEGGDNELNGGVVEVTLTNTTEALSRYIKPLPAVGTGNHRYVILIYPQPPSFPSYISSLITQNASWTTSYRGFDIAQFAREAGMGEPVAGFFVWGRTNLTST